MRSVLSYVKPLGCSYHSLVSLSQCRSPYSSQPVSKLASKRKASQTPISVILPPESSLSQPKRVLLTSDLHLKMANIDTALQYWHEHLLPQAAAHDADIAILGDIFHSYPYDMPAFHQFKSCLLNQDRHVYLLLGNHDMSNDTLRYGGRRETDLESFVGLPNVTVWHDPQMVFPGVGVVPYMRNHQHFVAAVQQLRGAGARVVLAHVGLQGAEFHDGAVSRVEVDPNELWTLPSATSMLSSDKGIHVIDTTTRDQAFHDGAFSIITGHYHKPQELAIGGNLAVYLGSPYETSYSEANQSKRMVLMDLAEHTIRDIPVQVGPKHYTVTVEGTGIAQVKALEPTLRKGDKLRFVTDDTAIFFKLKEQLGPDYQIERRRLRAKNVVNQAADTLQAPSAYSGLELLTMYFKEADVPMDIQAAAMQKVQQASQEPDNTTAYTAKLKQWGILQDDNHRHVKVQSVELQDYLSFRGTHVFNFDGMEGVYAVMGKNESDSGQVSNGTGKTTLVQACFRAMLSKQLKEENLAYQGRKGKGSAGFLVTLTALVNGVPVVVERGRATASKRISNITVNGEALSGSLLERDKLIELIFRATDLDQLNNAPPTIADLTSNPESVIKALLNNAPVVRIIERAADLVKEEKKAIDRKWHALEANFNRAIGAQEVLARQLGIESPTPTALGQALLKHVEQIHGLVEEHRRHLLEQVHSAQEYHSLELHTTRSTYLRLQHEYNQTPSQAYSPNRSFSQLSHSLTVDELLDTPYYPPSATAEEVEDPPSLLAQQELVHYHLKQHQDLDQKEHRNFERFGTSHDLLAEVPNLSHSLDKFSTVLHTLTQLSDSVADSHGATSNDLSAETLSQEADKLSTMLRSLDPLAANLHQHVALLTNWPDLQRETATIAEATEQRHQLLEQRDKLDKVLAIFDRGGIKQFLVDHVVTSVQAIASRWPLGTLKVELKATKERKTKSKALAGDIARCEAVLYKNDHRVTHLSSGEQRRVQIALFEALRSVLGGLAGVSCNIAIFDETLDTNVDDSGAEELMNGLKAQMAPGALTLVTCQQGSVVEQAADHAVLVVKDANGSRVEGWPTGRTKLE